MKLVERGGPATVAPGVATAGAAPAGWRGAERWLEAIFLTGLASVFLANAVTALLQPRDFTELVDQSAVAQWLALPTGSWLRLVIGANDLGLGLALLTSVWSRRVRLYILAWAGVWLLAVTAIRVTALEAFP